MMSLGHQPGQRLGKNHQGIKRPIQMPSQIGTAILDYSASFSHMNPHKHKQIPPASATRRLSPPANPEPAQSPVKVSANVMAMLFPKPISVKGKDILVPDPKVEEE